MGFYGRRRRMGDFVLFRICGGATKIGGRTVERGSTHKRQRKSFEIEILSRFRHVFAALTSSFAYCLRIQREGEGKVSRKGGFCEDAASRASIDEQLRAVVDEENVGEKEETKE